MIQPIFITYYLVNSGLSHNINHNVFIECSLTVLARRVMFHSFLSFRSRKTPRPLTHSLNHSKKSSKKKKKKKLTPPLPSHSRSLSVSLCLNQLRRTFPVTLALSALDAWGSTGPGRRQRKKTKKKKERTKKHTASVRVWELQGGDLLRLAQRGGSRRWLIGRACPPCLPACLFEVKSFWSWSFCSAEHSFFFRFTPLKLQSPCCDPRAEHTAFLVLCGCAFVVFCYFRLEVV